MKTVIFFFIITITLIAITNHSAHASFPELLLSSSSLGSEPRYNAKFTPEASKVFSGVMHMKIGVEISNSIAGGNSKAIETPWVNIPLKAHVTEAISEKRAKIIVSFGSPSMEENNGHHRMITQRLAASLHKLEGVTCSYTLDTRGLVSNMECTSDATQGNITSVNTTPFSSLFTVFPNKALGIGAVWQTKPAELTFGQFKASVTSVRTVTNINESGIDIKVDNNYIIPAQKINLGNSKSKTNPVQLSGGKGQASGKLSFLYKHPIPYGSLSGSWKVATPVATKNDNNPPAISVIISASVRITSLNN